MIRQKMICTSQVPAPKGQIGGGPGKGFPLMRPELPVPVAFAKHQAKGWVNTPDTFQISGSSKQLLVASAATEFRDLTLCTGRLLVGRIGALRPARLLPACTRPSIVF